MRRPAILLLAAALTWLTCAAPAGAGGYVPYAPDVLRAVADKTGIVGGVPVTQISSGSTSTTFRLRLHASAVTGFYNPQLIYSCSYLVNAAVDAACPNAMTVKAVIAVGSINYAVSCLGTDNGTSMPSGSAMVCDPVGVSIPANTTFYVCTYVSVVSGGWPLGRALASSVGGEGSSGINGADDTGSCAAGTGMTTGGYSYGPMAIVGHPMVRGQKAIGIVGDSICSGANSNFNTASGDSGYLEVALSNNVAWLSNCRSSDQVALFLSHLTWRLSYFPQFVTSVINELGTNDIYTANEGIASVESNLTALWGEFANRGISVFQTTILPRTTSTDMWATVANQTKYSSQEAVRVAANDWIRTIPSPLVGFFDPASTIEVNSAGVPTQDGGYWPPAISTTTGNTSSSTTITNIPSTAGMAVGEAINCSGCAAGSTISVINSSSQITLSAATSSTLTGATLVIGPSTYDGIHPSQSAIPGIAASIIVGQLQ